MKFLKFLMTMKKKRKERKIKMADLNQMELQNLRHFIGAHETIYQKHITLHIHIITCWVNGRDS